MKYKFSLSIYQIYQIYQFVKNAKKKKKNRASLHITHSQYKYDKEKSHKPLFNVLTTSELSCATWEVFNRGNIFKQKGTSMCVNKGL